MAIDVCTCRRCLTHIFPVGARTPFRERSKKLSSHRLSLTSATKATLGTGQWKKGRDRSELETLEKSLLHSRDDISGTGSATRAKQRAFQRGRFHASDEPRFVENVRSTWEMRRLISMGFRRDFSLSVKTYFTNCKNDFRQGAQLVSRKTT